jgi:hypothetical protein
MRKISLAIAAIALTTAFSGTANATISIGSIIPGTNPYSGPTPTYDWDTLGTTPATVGGGVITTGTTPGLYAQPYGSAGNYFSVGPSTLTPGYIDLTSFGDISSLSLLWGSVDSYNTLYFLDSSLSILASFTGDQIFNPANGNQTDPNTNPVVTFLLDGGSESQFAWLGMTSQQNAFEIDDITINGVPEPATWAMMLLGFGAVGMAMRRRKSSVTQLRQLA